MNIPKILKELRPGAEWTLTGNDYSGLDWTDGVQIKPTEAEIIAHDPTVEYKENRRNEYPPTHEQLEALMEGGQALADIKVRINATKAKYPKP